MKKYEVAVLVDKKGNTICCFKCKMVDEKEYNELINKTQATLDLKDKQIRELKNQISETNKAIAELKREIKVLKGEE